MRILLLFFFCLGLTGGSSLLAQNQVPFVELKTLDGNTADLKTHLSGAKLTVISFWATWCKPCQAELDAIAELYPEWQEQYGAQLIAITIDTQRQLAKVGPMVETKGWPYIILSDVNNLMRNALNFQAIPQTYVVDQQGNILYAHSGYVPGNEYELEEKLKALHQR